MSRPLVFLFACNGEPVAGRMGPFKVSAARKHISESKWATQDAAWDAFTTLGDRLLPMQGIFLDELDNRRMPDGYIRG